MRRFDRNSISRFLSGRYGPDELSRFLSLGGIAAILLSLLTRGVPGLSGLLSLLAVGMIVWCYYRILSKNMSARRAENSAYLARRQKVIDWYCLRRDCFRQRKDYAFFRCPGCGQTMRVPKGKGKLRITCRHCGYAFERKT